MSGSKRYAKRYVSTGKRSAAGAAVGAPETVNREKAGKGRGKRGRAGSAGEYGVGPGVSGAAGSAAAERSTVILAR
ncbi:hypothetical protein GCM10010195_25480 [Kitasatospora griseola]|nr:hypothetical protein GCM10010195_25480 [Kitasatospora griseola]